MGELKHEKGTNEAIAELKSLIRGHRINNNSPGKTNISGPISGRITKALISGKGRKSETDLRVGEIRIAFLDSAKKTKGRKQGKIKQYKRNRKQIQEQLRKLREKENKNNNTTRWEISDFEEEEFYGLRNDFEQRKAKIQEELRKEMGVKNI